MGLRGLFSATVPVFVLALASCAGAGPGASAAGPSEPDVAEPVDVAEPGDGDEPASNAPHDAHASDCGTSTDDWCAAPAGDPCGEHHDTESCRADVRCEAMPYRGESLVACATDARCFASNCPTVGCLSRCETLGEQPCEAHGYRCRWNGAQCERVDTCHR